MPNSPAVSKVPQLTVFVVTSKNYRHLPRFHVIRERASDLLPFAIPSDVGRRWIHQWYSGGCVHAQTWRGLGTGPMGILRQLVHRYVHMTSYSIPIVS